MSFLAEFFAFLRSRKKLWLIPVIVIVLAFGMLLVLAQTAALSPFIYALF